MRTIWGSLFLLFCISTFALGQREPTKALPKGVESAADIKAAIMKLEDANNAARLSGDSAVLKTIYADDFVGINAGGGMTDKTNIVDFYSTDGPVLAINTTDEVVVRPVGTAAIVTARLKYQYNSKMENKNIRWLRYTRVYEKRGSVWQVIAEHFSFTDDPHEK